MLYNSSKLKYLLSIFSCNRQQTTKIRNISAVISDTTQLLPHMQIRENKQIDQRANGIEKLMLTKSQS
jgi:hypothetical protein